MPKRISLSLMPRTFGADAPPGGRTGPTGKKKKDEGRDDDRKGARGGRRKRSGHDGDDW